MLVAGERGCAGVGMAAGQTLAVRVTLWVIAAAWLAMAAYWVAAARGLKVGRNRARRDLAIRVGRGVAFRVVIVLVVVVLIRAKVIRRGALIRDPWLEGAGIALVLIGLGVAVWARRCIGRNWGTPMTEKVDPDLITSGPYSRIRHPIYAGILLALVGTAIALTWYLLILAGAATAYFVTSATREERYMTQLFPDAYPAYRARTRMLIPFLL